VTFPIDRPEFVPDADLDREAMESLQYDVADVARFEDDLGFDPATVSASTGEDQKGKNDRPLVAGVDQAFLDDRAVSAVVVLRGGKIVERVHAVTDLSVPYVPGLLSFREGGPILAAVEELDSTPDLFVFDGSGRIHYREAGLATHLGVVLGTPSVGVAKSLLCGTSRDPLDRALPTGRRVAVEADDRVTASSGTVIGYALQTRQYDSPNRSINPVYVSPGHRVGAETATDLIERLCAGYKLPEPTRLADADADEAKAVVDRDNA
jgi:deoxyribonuclease V